MKVDWVPLGDVARLVRTPVDIERDATYQQIGVRGFGRGIFSYDPVPGDQLGRMRYFSLEPSRLVVSNIKGWEGAVDLTGPEESGRIISNRFLTYESEQVNLSYLRHWLLSDPGLRHLGSASPGSADRNRTLSIASFQKVPVPIVSPDRQEQITEHLEALKSRTTATAAPVPALLAKLVARAAEGASREVVGELLRAHRPWIEIVDSKSYRAIGVRGFGRGMIRYPECAAGGLSKLRYYPIEPDALIVSNIKAWEGAVCVADESDVGRIASNRFLQYVPKGPGIATGWVEQYLLSPAGLASLNAASPGSADRNRTLSMAAFEAIEIPVPALKTQESVMRVVRALRRVSAEQTRRDELAAAVLPAARNEIFNSMR